MSEAVYTKSQAAVIALTLSMLNGLILGHGYAWLQGFATPVYWWIMLYLALLPLYIRLVSRAFLMGILGYVTMIIWVIFYPLLLSENLWWMLYAPVYNLAYYVFFFGNITGIYWAFKSFKQLEARDLAREFRKRKSVEASYSLNQVGVIAALYNIAFMGIDFYGSSILFGFDHFFYPILIIAAWILLPFIIKLIKPAFIFGIILSVITMVYIGIFPSLTGMEPWYIYAPRLYNFAYVIFYSITILGIYFCYETYKELK